MTGDRRSTAFLVVGCGDEPVVGGGRPVDDGDVLSHPGTQFVEVPLLVLITKPRRALEQIVFRSNKRSPSQSGIESTQQCVLGQRAAGRKVRRAVDDDSIKNEHGRSVALFVPHDLAHGAVLKCE